MGVVKAIVPKIGAGVAQALLTAIALWAAPKVGFGAALGGLTAAQAALARAIGSATTGEAIAVGAPGAVAGGGLFFMG